MVKLQPIKLTECCTVATLSLYLRLNTFQDVILKKLDCGRMIPTPSHTNDENMITFIDMSDWSQLLNFSNLKWLDGHYETEDFKDVHEVRLANQSIGRTVLKEFGYQVDYDLEMSSVADCLKEIITEIQVNLWPYGPSWFIFLGFQDRILICQLIFTHFYARGLKIKLKTVQLFFLPASFFAFVFSSVSKNSPDGNRA